jgi:short-subunit dehydrogenase involved in D-alanine esterification of teichoic acids
MTGNTILVTGGTSGIGLGLALRFCQAGNKVIVAGRRKELLEQIAAGHEGIETLVLDVADPASIARAYETVSSRYPEVNVVINVAGIMLPEDLHDSGFLPAAESTVTTNLLGPIRMLAAFIPFLAEQKDAAVINVSSGLAFVPLPITPTYNATKAAIHSFTESLRVQLADTPVQVLELIPPAVRTALMGQQDSEQAMPLDDFLSEVMTILQTQPDPGQIIVDNVRFLRFAEAGGTYGKVLSLLSGTDHASEGKLPCPSS